MSITEDGSVDSKAEGHDEQSCSGSIGVALLVSRRVQYGSNLWLLGIHDEEISQELDSTKIS